MKDWSFAEISKIFMSVAIINCIELIIKQFFKIIEWNEMGTLTSASFNVLFKYINANIAATKLPLNCIPQPSPW